MCQRALIPSRGMFVLFPFLAGLALPASAATDARVSESYGKLPLHFEANRGQTHRDVHFLSHGPGYSLYLTAGEAVLVLSKPNADVKSIALRMSLVGAAPKPLVSGLEAQPGKVNYFIGNDPAQWRTSVPTYAKVQYENVYPGIDLIYYGNQRQLEYDFILAPGADPKKIALGFKGADKLEIDAQGELVLHAAGGDIRQHKPVIYQEIDGARREIAGGYVRKGASRVGFQVAAYDTSRPLIIDPVLLYSTYLGGSGSGGDTGNGIAVDAEGNAYVTGYTTSLDFPTTLNTFQSVFVPAGSNAFVTKLNPAGTGLVYSTYLGGSDSDGARGIAVDANGSAYVTGSTRSNDFPITAGAFQPTFAAPAGVFTAFVTKLDPSGSTLVYSTYLGGSGVYGDFSSGIAVDSAGNAHVIGTTSSNDFPTAAAFQPTLAGGSRFGAQNAFVTKLNSSGSALVYSTYLGGSSSRAPDSGYGIAVDVDGNAYVTGDTTSSNFPTTPGAFQPAISGPYFSGGIPQDAFVTKFNPAGSVVYSTYLGGSGDDSGVGITVDAAGNAYVTGGTGSFDFPTTAGVFQPASSGGAFVTKLNPTGSALVYSTYLSGNSGAGSRGIAVDANGNAYVAGGTILNCGRYSCFSDFPTTPGAFQPSYGGGSSDGFVTKVNPTGSALIYSSYLGGSGGDYVSGVALDPSGDAYVTGSTTSVNFPTTVGAFQPIPRGPGNAFVTKVVDMSPTPLLPQ